MGGRDDEVLGHVAIHLHRVLVAAERAAALAGEAALAVAAPVARRDGVDRYALAHVETGHRRSEFVNDAHGLVAERPAVGDRQRPSYGVHVRSADQRRRRSDDRILGTWLGDGLVDHPGLSDFLDHERTHGLRHGGLLRRGTGTRYGQGVTRAVSFWNTCRCLPMTPAGRTADTRPGQAAARRLSCSIPLTGSGISA